jgi:hypothetical protein
VFLRALCGNGFFDFFIHALPHKSAVSVLRSPDLLGVPLRPLR